MQIQLYRRKKQLNGTQEYVSNGNASIPVGFYVPCSYRKFYYFVANYVMRVENCWTGSSHNPIYLINEDGCSMEKTMIGTPRYESSLLESYSIGWLSVRLVGVTYVRLACQIRMCHICDKKCSLLTVKFCRY